MQIVGPQIAPQSEGPGGSSTQQSTGTMPRAIREITLAVVFHILLCIPSATTFVAAPLHHAQRFQTEARRTAAVSHTRRTSLRASPLACSYGPIVIQNGGVDALRVVPCGAGIPVAGPSQSGTNEVLIDATDGWGDGHHATTRVRDSP